MADVFISYSKRHAQLTEDLARDLEARGYATWWDTSLLPDDLHFPQTIREQIKAAKAVVVIWAEHSVGSRWVYSEAAEGDEQGKLFQVRDESLDPRDVPMPFKAGNIPPISDRQKLYAAFERKKIEPSKPANAAAKASHHGDVPPQEPAINLIVPEHEYWAETKDRADPNAFERFLARFPHGDFAELAARRASQRINACNDAQVLERLLVDFPSSPRTGRAKARLASLLWRGLKRSRYEAALEVFVRHFPKSAEAEKARTRLVKLQRRMPKVLAGAAIAALAVAAVWQPWRSESTVTVPPPTPEERAPSAATDKDFAAQLDALQYSDERAGTAQTAEDLKNSPLIVPLQAWNAGARPLATSNDDCSNGLLVAVAQSNMRPCIEPGSGESFKDCVECPEMVVVPSGGFMMGSPESEPERSGDESPQHRVTIPKPFAVGRFAVTRDEFEAFVKASGHRMDGGCYLYTGSEWKQDSATSYRSPGFAQTGSHPVVCVSWYDAKAYVTWLSKKTGKSYRLLTEAEREYAARAGTQSPFWWGTSITPDRANYDGNYTYGGGMKGEYRAKTVPVKSFEPNSWGLYQVLGNVYDWTEDCWHESYAGAPPDGSAWRTGECKYRVRRGGSWYGYPQSLRAANRINSNPGYRFGNGGFRVARTLNP